MIDGENNSPDTVTENKGNEVAVQNRHAKRSPMEIAIAIAGALALIFGIGITVASHYHKNSLIVWLTYLTVIFALLVPFLYWQKRENERQARVGFSDPLPVIKPSPVPSPSVSPTPLPEASKGISSPSSKPPKTDGSDSAISHIRPNTERPDYADLTRPRWTDYTEDYFFGAIWRWKYRPEMGDQEPRNIYGYCPDCNCALTHNPFPEKRKPDGFFIKAFYCHKHLGKHYWVRSTTRDPIDGIRALIRERLQSGGWEDVVKRQNDVRNGRV